MDTDTGPKKFMLCIDLQKGFVIIGILEVVATVLQVMNLMYSVRLGIAMLFLFNAPLLYTWVMSQLHRRKGDLDMSYQFNTLFMTVYFVRLLVILIGGFIFIIIAQRNDEPVDFLCDKYYGIDYNEDGTIPAEFVDDLGECRSMFRNLVWPIYIITVVFQAHCLFTLQNYRSLFENKEYIKETNFEDDI